MFVFATVHPKTGDVISSSVEERLRSLDAAWKRYDDCHHKLMSVGHGTLDSDKKEEQVKWETRLEEFCEAREEAIEILKSRGVDLKVRRIQVKILGGPMNNELNRYVYIREIIFYVYTKHRTYLRTQWTKFGETLSKTSAA